MNPDQVEEYLIVFVVSAYSMMILKKYLSIFFYRKPGTGAAVSWLLFFLYQMKINMSAMRFGFGTNLNVIFHVGLICLVLWMGYAGRLWKKIVFSFLFSALWIISEPLVQYGLMYLSKGVEPSVLEIWLLSKLLLGILVVVIWWFMKGEIGKEEFDDENMNGFWLGILAFGSIWIYYIFHKTGDAAGTKKVAGMLSAGALLLILINLLAYPIYRKLAEGVQEKRNSRYYMNQMRNYQHLTAETEEAITEIREIRHDLKHKLIYIQEAIKSGEYEFGEQVLSGLFREVEQSGRRISQSGNLEADALLNWKFREALAAGGDLQAQVEIPGDLGMEEGDLSVLLGNSLDNAIEALPGGGKGRPEILVRLKYGKGALLIEIRNEYEGNLDYDGDGRLRSRKQESGHGVGYRSMEQIVKKYHGEIQAQGENQIFTLSILLYCGSTQN